MKRNCLIYIIDIILTTACSHIADDDRLIYVPPVDVARAVLIEDFTGQRCVNCPDAADTIASLQRQYGDSAIIAVGIHGGPLAFAGNATNIGLLTDEGNAYVDHWAIDAFPKGLVNRATPASNCDQWPTLVREAISQPATVELSATARYDVATRRLSITTTALGLAALPEAHLQLWLTESAITALQMMPDGSVNRQYQHNHVFRTSVNGSWGEPFPLVEGQERTVNHTVAVADDWQPQHLAVVAFIYTPTGGVQQVVEARNTETSE